jgi:hypothetical protein
VPQKVSTVFRKNVCEVRNDESSRLWDRTYSAGYVTSRAEAEAGGGEGGEEALHPAILAFVVDVEMIARIAQTLVSTSKAIHNHQQLSSQPRCQVSEVGCQVPADRRLAPSPQYRLIYPILFLFILGTFPLLFKL